LFGAGVFPGLSSFLGFLVVGFSLFVCWFAGLHCWSADQQHCWSADQQCCWSAVSSGLLGLVCCIGVGFCVGIIGLCGGVLCVGEGSCGESLSDVAEMSSEEALL